MREERKEEREIYELAFKHALYNAFKHEGKAKLSVVISKMIAERIELKDRVKEILPIVQKAVEEANKMSREEQKRLIEERYPELLLEEKQESRREGLPPLPNVSKYKRVVTRFAPNPDFAIHLGNSRVAILSYEYARMYNGKMILRMEDTDPRTKTPIIEAYERIKEDLSWLEIKWSEEYIQSLRMNIYYEIVRKLLEKGGAYVDTLGKSEFVRYLESEKQYPPRAQTPEENLELFDKMLSGEFKEGEAVVRVKTEWGLSDRSLVDWVAFRIIDTERNPHPLVGTKYIVWPTYNFASAVDDHLMGVTHIIRGKEHESNTIKQRCLYSHLGWEYPTTIHVGRLKLEGFIMSKSFIRRLLEEGSEYAGPEDPRFGTLAGLRKRGITPQAIWNIMLEIGIKPTDAIVSFSNLAAENRKILDPIAPRVMFVKDPIALRVKGVNGGCISAKIPYHPERAELGSREIEVCENDEVHIAKDDFEEFKDKAVRLLGLGNFKVAESRRELELVSTGIEDAKRLKLQVIQWVQARRSLPANVLKPVGERLEVDSGFVEDVVRQDEMFKRIRNVQLVRYGFAYIETTTPAIKMVFSHT
uniref:Glutamate--tRNA ligase n=1 Tax=Fervidicoccus fontis TaxID=683846 RepID=A0A7J3ZLU5_9CREN